MRLYHAPMSTCSQKVRLVLAEKGLDYESELIDLQKGEQFAPDYLAKNPNGVVPTLEDEGRVLIESTLINEYLDDAYPRPALKPDAAADRHAMRLWCKRIDELHPACGVQTYAIGIRPGLMRRPKAEVDALVEAIPDPARRAARRSVVDRGIEAPEFASAYAAHVTLFDRAEETLADAPYLTGVAFTLADAAFLPYVLRVDHLNLVGLLRGRSALDDWYRRVQERPSYHTAVGAHLAEPAVAAFRRAGEAVADEVARIAAASR
ncbi:MAG: glutathione S-transferase family protein [Gammaproteobacteria bacterium]|jgi:glutathione S-transferase